VPSIQHALVDEFLGLVDKVEMGRSSLLVIAGPPGSGKSWILSDAYRRLAAQSGSTVLGLSTDPVRDRKAPWVQPECVVADLPVIWWGWRARAAQVAALAHSDQLDQLAGVPSTDERRRAAVVRLATTLGGLAGGRVASLLTSCCALPGC
jgi:ABC-type cobalamin/Fe3+-siderophores transport system ATPase subunit